MANMKTLYFLVVAAVSQSRKSWDRWCALLVAEVNLLKLAETANGGIPHVCKTEMILVKFDNGRSMLTK